MENAEISKSNPDVDALFMCGITTLFLLSTLVVLDLSNVLQTSWITFAPVLLLILFFFPCVWYAHHKKMDNIKSSVAVTLLIFFNSLAIVGLTYGAIRAGAPLSDSLMATVDGYFGLNMPAVYYWFGDNLGLYHILDQAYQSFGIQILVLPVALCMMGFSYNAYILATRMALTGIYGSALAAFFPTIGTIHYYGLERSISQISQFDYNKKMYNLFIDVRTDPSFVFTIDNIGGIISFPSGHTAMAIILTVSAWKLKYLRWPVLIINVLMIISTIPIGVHYFIDIVGGCFTASLAILTTRRVYDFQSLFQRIQWRSAPGIAQTAL